MIRRELHTDSDTPVSLFTALDDGMTCAALYESVEGSERWARRSLIALSRQPARVARQVAEVAPLIAGFALPEKPSSLLEGAFGYFTWEAAQAFIRLPALADSGLPLAEFFAPEAVLLYDHRRHSVEAFFADSAIEAHCMQRLSAPRPASLQDASTPTLRPATRAVTAADYQARVTRAKEYIAAGDAFQVVVSQRFSAPAAPLFAAYRQLRRNNPSPYLYYLRTQNLEAAGASPEVLVRVEDETVTVRPIAGTARRGHDEAEDKALAAALLADPKECAEHAMLVDLGRNDVGRVSQAGSVVVDPIMTIERYSHVMHIVSEVRGRLRPECDALAAFAAAFPAGTLSGAPKKRAMEIITELESAPRGLYSGAVGYFAGARACDFAIAIRSLCKVGDEVVAQAGAGIVYDSDPVAEDDECQRKAASPLSAVGVSTR